MSISPLPLPLLKCAYTAQQPHFFLLYPVGLQGGRLSLGQPSPLLSITCSTSKPHTLANGGARGRRQRLHAVMCGIARAKHLHAFHMCIHLYCRTTLNHLCSGSALSFGNAFAGIQYLHSAYAHEHTFVHWLQMTILAALRAHSTFAQ